MSLVDLQSRGTPVLGRGASILGTGSRLSRVLVSREGLPTQVLPADGIVSSVEFGTVVYNYDGWFDPAQPDRITVPEGVTRARLFCVPDLFPNSAFVFGDTITIMPSRNGVELQSYGRWLLPGNNGGNVNAIHTPPIAVVPGDYFGLMVATSSTFANSLDVLGTDRAMLGAVAVMRS